MPSVDDRVVAMKFDNNAFESKIANTIASLDKLKGSLDFANSRRGLDDLTLAGKNFNLNGIASSVEGIAGKFTAMGAVAFSIIEGITTRALSAGVSIVKSLSLDQVLSGFREYETNMNSIQTIMANTRSDNTTLQDVNKSLDELNHYADQTIYNFSQMTRNIGTFTAAGVNLETSTAAIKGIANLAAVSGSSADQASTAMYQLSQALASGTLKLMDWNSVVNAGMGGEVFQKALFETGKSLKTLKDVKLDTTFEEWKAAGNSFRGSLEEGWITADVLTNTLQGFTGDLTVAQIKALGYTEEQAQQIFEMGGVAKDAATKVKTLSQLIDTTKEAVGSGWSESFRIIFGNFEEARNVFTSFSTAIGGVVSASSESRNALLQNWKDLGGREVLIDGITKAFQALGGIIHILKDAFHDVFPPFTVVNLINMTHAFRDLMERLKPGPAQAVLLARTFRGVFSIFSIGIEVIKGIAHFFGSLFDQFNKSNDPNKGVLGFTARIGDAIYKLKTALVDGQGIADFFDNLGTTVGNFINNISTEGIVETLKGLVDKVKNALADMFNIDSLKVPDILSAAVDRLGERFGWITGIAETLGNVWDAVSSKFGVIRDKLQSFLDFVKTTFSGLPTAISDALKDTDYDTALDTVNTGLFGGLLLLFRKFVNGDMFKNLGGGLLTNISSSFSELTGVLSAMQANLKAETLQKIAIAIGLLTASIVVLSLIDSAALTKSMGAMAIGFGQLITVMGLMNKIMSGPKGAATLTIVSAGMIALATAMVILSVAAKIFATMEWEEIAKGLTAIGALLAGLAVAAKPLSENSAGMIRSGIGIIAIAVALNILALAVKSFAEMNWEALGQGLVGAAVGLTAIVLAMQQIPTKILLDSVGIIAIAVALNILALAVKSFAEMNWAEMSKGMVGIGAALLILAGAMHLMPNGASLALQGVGLALIGAGLVAISKAIASLGGMSWKAMAKGLVGIAGAMIVLALGMAGMEAGIPGAIAVGIMAISLSKLTDVIIKMSKIKWGDFAKGLGMIVIALVAIGLAGLLLEPAVPALLAFGLALILVGAGFALFGLGANLVATAFAILATAGTQGVATLMTALEGLIEHLPAIISAFGDGILQLATKVIEALPEIIGGLSEVIQALLQLVIDNIPKLAETFVALIHGGLKAIRETTPDVIETGLQLLLDLLKGISEHVEEVVGTVLEIITKFLEEVASHTQDIVTAGLSILTNLLLGISDNIGDVVGGVGEIIVKFLESIGTWTIKIIAAGIGIILDLIKGMASGAVDIVNAGVDAVISFAEGLEKNALRLADAAFVIITDFLNGLAEVIRTRGAELRAAGANLVAGVIEGMTGVDTKKGMGNAARGIFSNFIDPLHIIIKDGSPARVMIPIGKNIVDGLAVGLGMTGSVETKAKDLANGVVASLGNSLASIPPLLANLDGMDVSPKITPIIDLTQVKIGAGKISGLIDNVQNIQGSLSLQQANNISATTLTKQQEDVTTSTQNTGPTEIKFEQNNYSPKALSAVDIYRQTRNQIAMAKEELAVK